MGIRVQGPTEQLHLWLVHLGQVPGSYFPVYTLLTLSQVLAKHFTGVIPFIPHFGHGIEELLSSVSKW